MDEQNNILGPFQNNQNHNENEDLINDENVNKKLKKLKYIYCFILSILMIAEVFIEYLAVLTYKSNSDSDYFGVYMVFFLLAPISFYFSIIILICTCNDYYPFTKIIIFIILFIIVVLYIIELKCLLIITIFLIIVTFGFIVIAISYEIILKKTKKFNY